jgi:hypothetical protein
MANNNRYGFLDLISKIVSLTHLCHGFNKLENKHLRWFGVQYLQAWYLFVYEEKKLQCNCKNIFFLLLQEILNSNQERVYFRK